MEDIRGAANLTDEALLTCAARNPSAFEILVARHQRDFLDRATFVLKNRDDAEDVVQDTFVRIYRFADRFDAAQGNFRSWAITILMNVARTRYQKRAKEWLRTAPLTTEHYESLAAPSLQEATLARDVVERALEKTSRDIARIIRLAFIEGLPYAEIAEREGVSVGAIKTRIHRYKKELHKIIGEIEI